MAETRMDRWKYFHITHRYHAVCNPMSVEKIDALYDLLDIDRGARVVDVACGKAEMLVRLVERFGVEGSGVDASPFCIADAEEKRRRRVPNADLNFICVDGAEYRPDRPESLDLAMCIGASWVFGGHHGTLRALKEMVRPGGLILVGEPYWLQKPSGEYLAAEEFSEEDFGAHYDNVAIGEAEGLASLHSVVSGHDDWDTYEGLQWYAAEQYSRSHPDDPDVPELMKRTTRSRDIYLRWGRDVLGWAMYLFRKPGQSQAS